MISFIGALVQIRRKDGGLITLSVSPYPSMLYDLCR